MGELYSRSYRCDSHLISLGQDAYAFAFNRAHSLRLFATPFTSLMETPDGRIEISDLDLLHSRVASLMSVCSTLALVVCASSFNVPEHRYIRALETLERKPSLHSHRDLDEFRF